MIYLPQKSKYILFILKKVHFGNKIKLLGLKLSHAMEDLEGTCFLAIVIPALI